MWYFASEFYGRKFYGYKIIGIIQSCEELSGALQFIDEDCVVYKIH